MNSLGGNSLPNEGLLNPGAQVASMQEAADSRFGHLRLVSNQELVDFVEQLRNAEPQPELACLFMTMAKKLREPGLVDDAYAAIGKLEQGELKSYLYAECSNTYNVLDRQRQAAVAAQQIDASTPLLRQKKFKRLASAARSLADNGFIEDAQVVARSIDKEQSAVYQEWVSGLSKPTANTKQRAKTIEALSKVQPKSESLPRKYKESIRPGTVLKRKEAPVPSKILPKLEALESLETTEAEPEENRDWTPLNTGLPEIPSEMHDQLTECCDYLIEDLQKKWRFLYEEGETIVFQDDIRAALGFESITLKEEGETINISLVHASGTFGGYLSKSYNLDGKTRETLEAPKAELVRYIALTELQKLLCTQDKAGPYERKDGISDDEVLKRVPYFYELPLGQTFSVRAIHLAQTMRNEDLIARNRQHVQDGGRRLITFNSGVKKPGAPQEPIVHIRKF